MKELKGIRQVIIEEQEQELDNWWASQQLMGKEIIKIVFERYVDKWLEEEELRQWAVPNRYNLLDGTRS